MRGEPAEGKVMKGYAEEQRKTRLSSLESRPCPRDERWRPPACSD